MHIIDCCKKKKKDIETEKLKFKVKREQKACKYSLINNACALNCGKNEWLKIRDSPFKGICFKEINTRDITIRDMHDEIVCILCMTLSW